MSDQAQASAKVKMAAKMDASPAARCVGSNIRRTDRVITQFYDAILAPSGITTPQFGLLSTLKHAAPITINDLAELLSIDRTTLTRNLGLLIKEGFVRSEEGADRRMRLMLLTPQGEEAIQRAWPLWQEAQSRIERALGRERVDALLAELAALRAFAG
jgi:DNA-binding MarR family transcriptional regulator